MAATFLLLLVMVQVAAAMTARSAADAAVAAATRRASLTGADVQGEEGRLRDVVIALVPGAEAVTADLTVSSGVAHGEVRFSWLPPGPGFARVTIAVWAEVPLAVAP